jgi:head-tail adaptor
MATASQRTELIVFQRPTTTTNEYNEEETVWTHHLSRRARVRFGTAQEKREAAQEGGVQAATFECISSADLREISLKHRILYLGSGWDITEIAPLDRKTIRFTAARTL